MDESIRIRPMRAPTTPAPPSPAAKPPLPTSYPVGRPSSPSEDEDGKCSFAFSFSVLISALDKMSFGDKQCSESSMQEFSARDGKINGLFSLVV